MLRPGWGLFGVQRGGRRKYSLRLFTVSNSARVATVTMPSPNTLPPPSRKATSSSSLTHAQSTDPECGASSGSAASHVFSYFLKSTGTVYLYLRTSIWYCGEFLASHCPTGMVNVFAPLKLPPPLTPRPSLPRLATHSSYSRRFHSSSFPPQSTTWSVAVVAAVAALLVAWQ